MGEIDVICEAQDWEQVPDLAGRVTKAAEAALHAERKIGAGLAILLTNDPAMQRLNGDFRGKEQPTNVLSFPAHMRSGANSLFLGDIALGYETCMAEASAEGKSLGDHLAHLVVHGCLHLMGFDHETEAEAEAMEARERVILASLGISDPYSGAEEAPLDE
ncbi:COG0319 Predicted metal-dependent hydrolase [Rhabdaerophilaceae bacterium]